MIPSSLLFAAVLLANSPFASSAIAVSNPGVSQHEPVPFGLSIDPANSGYSSLLEADRARFMSFYTGSPRNPNLPRRSQDRNRNRKRAASIQASNSAVTYTTTVSIGKPATNYTLLIDTGSSNTWVGASTPYVKTNTSINTGYKVAVQYSSGSFTGTEYTDQVALSGTLVIKNQSIGVATKKTASGFYNIDGIIGVGPTDLTYGTLSQPSNTSHLPKPPSLIPTVSDNLASQKVVSSNVLGISYLPLYTSPSSTGELTFGGVDTSKFVGTINYVPLSGTYPSSEFWGINQSVKYGSTVLLKAGTAGIVDTGTTLTLLATDAYNKYRSLTGATPDSSTGLLRIAPASYSKLLPLSFTIGSNTYQMSPNAQILPRTLNRAIGGTSNYIYLIIGDLGTPSGQGLDFINGYTFLERFYSVFDATNSRFGIAQTIYTNATTN